MTKRKKNAEVPILYSNKLNRPPMTERPAIVLVGPNEGAALGVLDGLDPDDVVVLAPPTPDSGSFSADLHLNVP